jgi:uncharacterized membrane protein (UPF0182 family)
LPGNDGGRNNTLSSGTNPIEPLYQMMKLPGENNQEFVLTTPFVPRGRPNQLTSFMAARSDPGQYGRLVVYRTPDNSTAPSPSRAATAIESSEDISRTFSLLDQRGSRVVRGAVQLLPVNDSILYMRPIFVEGRGASSYPRFRFVAMTYGDEAVLAYSVTEAVDALFGDAPNVPEDPTEEPPDQGPGEEPPNEGPPDEEPPGTTAPPGDGSVAELLAQAQDEFEQAQRALDEGDLGAYQEHVAEAQRLVAAAIEAQGGSPPSTPTPPTTAAPAVAGR